MTRFESHSERGVAARRGSSRTELDRETLERVKRGDRDAFLAFVRCYERPLFAFLSRWLGCGTHVEDIAQDTFVRAHQAIARFDADGSARLSTWLFAIATRLAIDRGRKEGRSHDAPNDPGAAPQTPEHEASRKQLGNALREAIESVPEEFRAIFVLVEFHDLSLRDAANVLSIREATAKTRLFRAREKLRDLLTEGGFRP